MAKSGKGPRVIIKMSSTESPYRFTTTKKQAQPPPAPRTEALRPRDRSTRPLPRGEVAPRRRRPSLGSSTNGIAMSRKCQVTGKRPLTGCNVSHANNKTKKRQLPNLQSKRIFVPELGRRVRVRGLDVGSALHRQDGAGGLPEEERAFAQRRSLKDLPTWPGAHRPSTSQSVDDLARAPRPAKRPAGKARRRANSRSATGPTSNAERSHDYGNCKSWITHCKSYITVWGDERSGPAGMQRASNAVEGLSTGC